MALRSTTRPASGSRAWPTRCPPIVSSIESQSIEINDTFTMKNWTFNVGFAVPNDTYFGAGLRETGQGVSGFEIAPGNKYEMYDIGFGDMIQPRLGATWSWNGRDKAYASYARYNPAASSLPRAASWDRNLQREIDIQFDRTAPIWRPTRCGRLRVSGSRTGSIPATSTSSSSATTGRSRAAGRPEPLPLPQGQELLGGHQQRRTGHLEPPAGIPRELYIPNLDEIRDEIGGSSYVIAQLDDAFTDYYEVALEAEYRSAKWYAQAGYTWSQYYGNFDQDNTTTSNDGNIFVGSSFIADGLGVSSGTTDTATCVATGATSSRSSVTTTCTGTRPLVPSLSIRTDSPGRPGT